MVRLFSFKKLFRKQTRKNKEEKQANAEDTTAEGEEYYEEDEVQVKIGERVMVSNPRRWSYASRREGCKKEASTTSLIPDEEVEKLVNGLARSIQSASIHKQAKRKNKVAEKSPLRRSNFSRGSPVYTNKEGKKPKPDTLLNNNTPNDVKDKNEAIQDMLDNIAHKRAQKRRTFRSVTIYD
eukprot:Phypoly_transcript_17060.p1 GENE.Phypoly_transcript_17060~~Phypoly_transcript_17060.p1  ORF type:complete len:181 (+),score=35.19 Phypoly_transcript_17060:186-728(+)